MIRVAPLVAVTAFGETVYLAHLPDGPIRVLEGTAALIWRHALTVPRSRLAAALLDEVEGDPSTISEEVSAFVDSLLKQGLLVDDGHG